MWYIGKIDIPILDTVQMITLINDLSLSAPFSFHSFCTSAISNPLMLLHIWKTWHRKIIQRCNPINLRIMKNVLFHSCSFLFPPIFLNYSKDNIFEYFRLTALFKNWKLFKEWLKMCSQKYFHFPHRKWKEKVKRGNNNDKKVFSKSLVAPLALAPNFLFSWDGHQSLHLGFFNV